jgi:protein involved in plasmid replication-relaxation
MTGRYLTAARLRDLEQQLSGHDLAVLKSVSDLRFMTGAQLARLHFDGDKSSRARAARRALLRLSRSECLSRLSRVVGGVRAGSSGFVYALGIAGQKIAMDYGWQPKRRGRRSRAPGTLFLRHCLDIAELHVLLGEADRARRLELLELAAEPACHRDFAGLGSQRILKPDSFLRFALRDYEWSWFIEVDRATEGSRAVERKLRDYLAFEASGVEQEQRGVFPKVLWTVPDDNRAAVIEGEIQQLPKGGRELFAVSQFNNAMRAITTPEVGTES